MQPNPYTRLVELCERLVVATTGGRAEWEREEETAFRWRLPGGTVAVRSRDHDGEPPYELVIFGPGGEKVESMLSEWTAEEEPAFWNQALVDLYRAARRQALGVDKILDDLFAELPPARVQSEKAPA